MTHENSRESTYTSSKSSSEVEAEGGLDRSSVSVERDYREGEFVVTYPDEGILVRRDRLSHAFSELADALRAEGK